MRVTAVRVTPTDQPNVDREWKFALASSTGSAGILIEIDTDEGVTGIGHAAASAHIGEWRPGMQSVVEELLAPRIVDCDPFDISKIMSKVDRSIDGYSRTKAGIETALFDLVGRALGVPVYKLLGGLYREEIPVLRIVPIKDPNRMAANALALVEEGYRYLKIKVGVDAREDVERVRAIRKAVGPEVALTLDANQGWTPKEAIDALSRMEELDVTLVEQPVRADDYQGLAQVRAAVRPLVEADESARSLSDIFQLAQADCVDAVSLKTGKLGGATAVKKAAGVCEAANLKCRIGMSTATRLAAAMDMHLIAAIPNIDFACEVGEFARMQSDPTEGLEIVDGKLRVPREPGLGISLRVATLAGRSN